MKILFTLHIMWYESEMIPELLDSLRLAIENCDCDIDILICLNSQTYIETPTVKNHETLFYRFFNHDIFKRASVIEKKQYDSFYNIGDWRRDIYGSKYDYDYIVWGESDCLVPKSYFKTLDTLNKNDTLKEFPCHIISFANRRMWDDSWYSVEHDYIATMFKNSNNDVDAYYPLHHNHYISLSELNEFNSRFDNTLMIRQIQPLKIDGNLTSLSKNLPYPFLPLDLHFAREDYCLQQFFTIKQIPQFLISSILKGHNSCHPKKRLFTNSSRNDEIFKKYETEAYESINRFINLNLPTKTQIEIGRDFLNFKTFNV